MLEAAELKRLAYLEAMGMESYVSRQPLPAAAPSRKLAIVTGSVSVRPKPVKSSTAPPASLLADLQPAAPPAAQPEAPLPKVVKNSETVESFSIVALFAGGWLWLEELSGVPLATEQVQLISAMARALNLTPEKPLVAQFDWPIHTNQQLDLGPEAAVSSLTGFIQRKLVEFKAGGVVILGEPCQRRLPNTLDDSRQWITTVSTRRMLNEPSTKKRAWRDLSGIVKAA